jgi:hypothetical protein
MELSKQEQEIKKLGQEAKSFLGSSLFKALQQQLSSKLEQEYPKPNRRGWEEKYRYAKAYERAAADIVEYLVSLRSNYEMLVKKENEKEKSIEEA